ncbi:UDP-N-acetylmuramoyl-tripeptide--D-alanyl-D-alanine ligase [Candidatus Saccharibacteria bacterium]|nr:UDP-N-acetylmuramoyl-tripeptide--D-alanyl-D-alanine ligase [Candidatus Saccharibacteria bacterium]
MFKNYIQKKMEGYVVKYFAAHPEVKLVVVAGSVGKTSTKLAIATVLSQRFRVRMHEGNHNAHLSAPLAILGIDYPGNINSLGAWLSVFRAAKTRIKEPTDVDVIVQELGTDKIGEVAHFGTYLRPDIGVVTAVSPEHMEFFHNIETVAQEELTAANFSVHALINRDDIDGTYSKYLTNANINTYGTSASAEYHFIDEDYTIESGHTGKFIVPDWEEPVTAHIKVLGEHSLRPAIAAGAVAVKLGLNDTEIAAGLSKIRAVPGRMNVLRGVEDTIIIDDTYNSSPLAAACAIQALYKLTVPQRIAVLGSMNELGDGSAAEHQALGMLCDPNQLAWVVTVGEEAEKYLAPSARAQGCQVKICKNALEAGGFVHSALESGAAILFKGSQGGIFLEEAVKVVLHSTEEENNLVRQSPVWIEQKSKFFSRF